MIEPTSSQSSLFTKLSKGRRLKGKDYVHLEELNCTMPFIEEFSRDGNLYLRWFGYKLDTQESVSSQIQENLIIDMYDSYGNKISD